MSHSTMHLTAVPEGWVLRDLDGTTAFRAVGRDARRSCLAEAARRGVLCLRCD